MKNAKPNILIVDRDESRRLKLRTLLAAMCEVTDLERPEELPSKGEDPLEEYDIALIHARDAEKNDGELEMVCFASPNPVVIFSGGFSQAEECENNVVEIPDSDLLDHCVDGIKFFMETGKSNLTAWTLGYGAAKKQAVAELCKILRGPVITGKDEEKRDLASGKGAGVIRELRGLCLDRRYQKQLDDLQEVLEKLDWDAFASKIDKVIELAR